MGGVEQNNLKACACLVGGIFLGTLKKAHLAVSLLQTLTCLPALLSLSALPSLPNFPILLFLTTLLSPIFPFFLASCFQIGWKKSEEEEEEENFSVWKKKTP